MRSAIKVGNLVCVINANEQVTKAVQDNCADFLHDGKGYDIKLDIRVTKSIVLRERIHDGRTEVYLDKESIMMQDNNYYIKCRQFKGALIIKGRHFIGEFNIRYNRKYLWYIIRNLVRACYAVASVNNHAFLVHSSCIVHDKKAYMFLGLSGAGKTTAARLTKAKVLSDESVMIVRSGSSLIAYGTPFGGRMKPSNAHAALSKIFFLVQDKRTYFRRLKPIQSLPEFMQHEFLSFTIEFHKNPGLSRRLFRQAYDFLKRIPCYELHFTLNDNLMRRIDETEG